MMYTVVEAFMPITNMIVSQVRQRGVVSACHKRLAEAIADRDDKAAAAVLSNLLDHLRDSYTASLEQRRARKAGREGTGRRA
jgi:DNA-binding GntR family transcriptional regulator